MKIRTIIVAILFSLCLSACGHKHTFVEPTCTEPAICEKCGETAGEPLGHTTKLGKCTNCNEYMGTSVLLNLAADIKDIHNKSHKATNYLNALSSYDQASIHGTLQLCASEYKAMLKNYDKAITSCEGYSELLTIKGDLFFAKNALPTDEPSNNNYAHQIYLADMENYLLKEADVLMDLISLSNLVSESNKLEMISWIYD